MPERKQQCEFSTATERPTATNTSDASPQNRPPSGSSTGTYTPCGKCATSPPPPPTTRSSGTTSAPTSPRTRPPSTLTWRKSDAEALQERRLREAGQESRLVQHARCALGTPRKPARSYHVPRGLRHRRMQPEVLRTRLAHSTLRQMETARRADWRRR